MPNQPFWRYLINKLHGVSKDLVEIIKKHESQLRLISDLDPSSWNQPFGDNHEFFELCLIKRNGNGLVPSFTDFLQDLSFGDWTLAELESILGPGKDKFPQGPIWKVRSLFTHYEICESPISQFFIQKIDKVAQAFEEKAVRLSKDPEKQDQFSISACLESDIESGGELSDPPSS